MHRAWTHSARGCICRGSFHIRNEDGQVQELETIGNLTIRLADAAKSEKVIRNISTFRRKMEVNDKLSRLMVGDFGLSRVN